VGRFAAFALLMAACTPAPAEPVPVTAAAPAGTRSKRGEGPQREVRPTEMAEELSKWGLDIHNLPPLESLDRSTKLRVMNTFVTVLGGACPDCHYEIDFRADTRRKRVAKRMWNEITRVVALEDGSPAYCDSCHQKDLFILDRRKTSKVQHFMNDVFAKKLIRTDGHEHDCKTCHGDPMNEHFLTTWRETPAPDIDPVTK
jgi:hypothetical protein